MWCLLIRIADSIVLSHIVHASLPLKYAHRGLFVLLPEYRLTPKYTGFK